MTWKLAEKNIDSRLLLGTAQYPSLEILEQSIQNSRTNVITVSLRRQTHQNRDDHLFWDILKKSNCHLLPNTAGCNNAEDAVTTAEIARELFNTHWIKLEVIGDDFTLQPDPFELVKAATILIKKGFEVFPYCTDDLILCQRLVDCGCTILMPWGSPIGSGKGLLNPYALEVLRTRFSDKTLIIDAGIGKPSHAAQAMEMGFDAVLLNTAVSAAFSPVAMASAFRDAIDAGHTAFNAGLMKEKKFACASTSLIDTPFWHRESIDE